MVVHRHTSPHVATRRHTYSVMWCFTLRTFLVTVVLICFARSAYFNVLIVSSNDDPGGATLHSMTVRQLPPSESLSSRVSLESRYGTYAPLATFMVKIMKYRQYGRGYRSEVVILCSGTVLRCCGVM